MIVNNKIEYFFINKCVQISVPNFKDYDVFKNYVQRSRLGVVAEFINVELGTEVE